jgi:hypothetical protein
MVVLIEKGICEANIVRLWLDAMNVIQIFVMQLIMYIDPIFAELTKSSTRFIRAIRAMQFTMYL